MEPSLCNKIHKKHGIERKSVVVGLTTNLHDVLRDEHEVDATEANMSYKQECRNDVTHSCCVLGALSWPEFKGHLSRLLVAEG